MPSIGFTRASDRWRGGQHIDTSPFSWRETRANAIVDRGSSPLRLVVCVSWCSNDEPEVRLGAFVSVCNDVVDMLKLEPLMVQYTCTLFHGSQIPERYLHYENSELF